MDVEVVEAGRADHDVLAAVLARAFEDDPVQAYVVRGEDRLRRIGLLMRMELRGLHARGRVLTTTDRAGAALWAAPERWRTPVTEVLRAVPDVLRAFRGDALLALRALQVLEAAHPEEPHWYLGVLGTDPAAQGRGVGSALLAPVLAECDRDGVPAFLESSKFENIPFYERHGFAVTEQVVMPDGPPLWQMWRDPR